jgi:hypothetical protein
MVQVTVKNGVYFLNVRCSISETSLWRLLVLSPDKQINVAPVLWDACLQEHWIPFWPCYHRHSLSHWRPSPGKTRFCMHFMSCLMKLKLERGLIFDIPRGLLRGRLDSASIFCKAQWSKSLNEVQSMTIVSPFLYILLVSCVIKNMMLAWFCTLTQVSRAGKYPEVAALVLFVHCFSCSMVDIVLFPLNRHPQSALTDYSWVSGCMVVVWLLGDYIRLPVHLVGYS